MNIEVVTKIKLGSGDWEWWFRDKETLEQLTSRYRIKLFETTTTMSFVTPQELIDRPNTVIFIQKVRQ